VLSAVVTIRESSATMKEASEASMRTQNFVAFSAALSIVCSSHDRAEAARSHETRESGERILEKIFDENSRYRESFGPAAASPPYGTAALRRDGLRVLVV
jgi:hypothetical protein